MTVERQEAGDLPGLPIRFLQVFVSPGKLFAALRASPVSTGALTVGCVFVALSNLTLPIEAFEAVIGEAAGELPEDLSDAARIAKWASVGVAPVFWVAAWFLGACFNALLFKLALGYGGTFQQYRAVTAHALLVAALGLLLLAPARIFTENAQMTLTVRALLPGIGEGLLARFLGLLDLFNLWVAALSGVGAAVLDGHRGAGASVAYSLTAAALIALGIAAIFR